MATKTLCDGCDRELDGKGKDAWWLAMQGRFTAVNLQHTSFQLGPWDLCADCIKRLKERSDPMKWERS